MPLSRSRVFAAGLLTAGLGTAAVLGWAVPAPTQNAPLLVADKQEETKQPDGSIRVDAPSTEVEVDKERGKLSIKAPHTDVRVDPDKGRVQVRAPYVNLDIRW